MSNSIRPTCFKLVYGNRAWPLGKVLGQARLKLARFGYHCNLSKNSPDLEEEFGMTVVADGTTDFDWPKYCVHN